MRHMVLRGLIALVWMVAAMVCLVSGNMQMAAVYGIVAVAYGISIWKNRDNMNKTTVK